VDEPNLPKITGGILGSVEPKPKMQPGTGSVVFFRDPAQVAEGFAIALRVMGIEQSKLGGDSDA